MKNFKTPILFLVFNRPKETKQVFEIIRKIKPRRLFVAADGPRIDKKNENEICNHVRELATSIDWDCELVTLFRERNLGCKYAVSSAINWFFEQVDEGIILEDDCLPELSFFLYCEVLLKKYKSNEEVMHISGANLNDDLKFGDGTYFYSNYPNIWGWATWKRAWKKYDLELENTAFYSRLIKSTFKFQSERTFWKSRIELLRTKGLDTWDYQWMFSIWKEKGICLNSNYNLVENIGFGNNSTHTKNKNPYLTPKTNQIVKVIHPSKFRILENAEIEFISTLHGLKRMRDFEYYLDKYFFQRCRNLFHKIKLKRTKLD